MILKILVIKDSRPGHFNQSEGVVEALRRRCDVDVVYFELDRKPVLPSRIFRWLVNGNLLPFSVALILAGVSKTERQRLLDLKLDLLISTGGETLAMNALISTYHTVPNIVSGSLRGMSSDRFSAVLHVDPTLEGRENYIVGLKPSTVERLDRSLRAECDRKYCLLVGGPTRYQPTEIKHWDSIASFLSASTLYWSIVTSRRTPDSVCKLLTDLAAAKTNVTLHDFRNTGSGVAAEMIQESVGVVVTEDSTSMISEGVAAGIPVVSLRVEGGGPSSDASYIELMKSRNWYRPIDMMSATEDIILKELELCTPTTESHLDILADRLFKQIPELNQFQR